MIPNKYVEHTQLLFNTAIYKKEKEKKKNQNWKKHRKAEYLKQ